MKKLILALLFLLLSYSVSLAANQQLAWMGPVIAGCAASGYCSSQSWATLSSFKLDFDHPSGTKIACLASGTETGTLADDDIATPAVPSPGSGGNALVLDGNNDYITFTNSGPYFRSAYGQILLKISIAATSTTSLSIFQAVGVADQDRLIVGLSNASKPELIWEDNNAGGQSATFDYDLDTVCGGNCYGKWVQLHIIWDTTLGANEIGIRARYHDGTNWQDWSSFTYKDYDASAWATEPGATSYSGGPGIRIGLIGTASTTIYIDDVEISYDKP